VRGLEPALFEPGSLPWDPLAFPTDHVALRWLRGSAAGGVHLAEFSWQDDGRILMRRR
jgi:hypothetical protein